MSNSFGFSTNNQVRTFLSANLATFASMVASHSVLLTRYQDEARRSEVLNIALQQVYPRIGLLLSSARYPDNTFLFGDTDLLRFTKVVEILVSTSGPYHEGITAIAAALVAAKLIRSIPINSDIKNIDLGDGIEKQAYSDLERIIRFFEGGGGGTVTTELDELPSIYFALDVDLVTIPEIVFTGSLVDLDKTRPNNPVLQLTSITIPTSSISFILVYLSARRIGDLPDTDSSKTILVPVTTGMTIYDLTTSIADAINTSSLDSGKLTNVIAAINPVAPRSIQQDFDRRLLYGGPSTSVARASVWFEAVALAFNPRRTDAINSRELLILSPYTVSKTNLLGEQYKGNWVAGAYQVNDIVEYNGKYYKAIADTSATIPDSTWELFTITDELLISKREVAQPMIAGLLHGALPLPAEMNRVGARSLTMKVDNNGYKAIEVMMDEPSFNTFYFKNTSSLSGQIGIRLSSTSLEDQQVLPLNSNGAIPLNLSGLDAVGICELIIKTLYDYSSSTEVLGALVVDKEGNPGVTLTAYREAKVENKEVIDLVRIGAFPDGLLVAVGDARAPRTSFISSPRSLILPIIKQDNLRENRAEAIKGNPIAAGVKRVVTPSLSSKLKSTMEKINQLNGFTAPYHHEDFSNPQ